MLQEQQDYQSFFSEDEEIPEEEIETVYFRVYSDDPDTRFWQKIQWPKFPKSASHMILICMQMIAVAMLSGVAFIPGMLSYTPQTITVPAILLPLQQFKASVDIIPTGIHNYPATRAKGTLTLYNGSSLTEQLPTGFIVTTSTNIEIATDASVLIPGAHLPNVGIATVSAHAVIGGIQGNIAPYTLQAMYGSSISIKNLTAFSGGHDSHTETYSTGDDQTKALNAARAQLQDEQATQSHTGLLTGPCKEAVKQSETEITVTSACQYLTYHAPANAKVFYARIDGVNVILTVQTVAQTA